MDVIVDVDVDGGAMMYDKEDPFHNRLSFNRTVDWRMIDGDDAPLATTRKVLLLYDVARCRELRWCRSTPEKM